MEKKIGCYICTGCGIGTTLDVDALQKVATKEQKIPVVRNHEFLCGTAGVELIRQDMANEGVNAVIIGACSPRAQSEAFRFDTSLLDRVNLREHAVWSQPEGDGDDTAVEDRQMIAEDNLRMGCVKVKKMNVPEPFIDPGFSKDILVVGGGLAGLTAAKNIAEAGYKAIIVEKAAELGGMLRRMHKVSPSQPPYRDLEANPLPALLQSVTNHANVKVYTSAAIRSTSGQPGLFDVVIASPSGEVTERVGSVVLATGYNLYDAGQLSHLGYGSSPDVITSIEFEEMAKAGNIVRKSDGKPAKRVAFSLCAGQRDANHLEYCSGACCIYSLKQALYVKEAYDDASTYILFQEIRTPGQMEDFYRKVQNEGGIFIKGDIQQVRAGQDGLTVDIKDKLLRSDESLEVDLLVLATGMVPNIDTYNPNDPSPVGQDTTELQARSVLNLNYRQGLSLPSLKWGFPDSHFICFPYETRRTGIYAAGPVRRPMGVAAAATDATGAALKAIQAVESVARGAAVHPRSGDLSYPSFRREGCTQCKRCTEECPYGAINEDEKGNPLFNPTRCRRCGTCMGACPQKIISFANYSVDMIGSMIKEVDIPDQDAEKPRVLVLLCENDAYPALDTACQNRRQISPYVRFVPLRCMGSMSLVWIVDAMNSGYDGILLLGCRHGDDYQCHNVRGSALAETRLSKISETLSRMQLEPDRVKMVEVNIMDADTLPDTINAFVATLQQMEPNPYKGF
ncbi:MAG: hydrogenase iron-sulfur subunit [Magnetococcales bacterium]|nr:hydrogenase iron-sulfur subunit [Magnetococcales bacterium]